MFKLSSKAKTLIEGYYIECPDNYSFEKSCDYVVNKLIDKDDFVDAPILYRAVYNFMCLIHDLV